MQLCYTCLQLFFYSHIVVKLLPLGNHNNIDFCASVLGRVSVVDVPMLIFGVYFTGYPAASG